MVLPEEQLEALLGKMCQRLDQFEKESLAVTQATLGEFNARLDQIKDTFSLHLNKTNSAVGELSQKIDERSRVETVTESEKSRTAVQCRTLQARRQLIRNVAESGMMPKTGLIRTHIQLSSPLIYCAAKL